MDITRSYTYIAKLRWKLLGMIFISAMFAFVGLDLYLERAYIENIEYFGFLIMFFYCLYLTVIQYCTMLKCEKTLHVEYRHNHLIWREYLNDDLLLEKIIHVSELKTLKKKISRWCWIYIDFTLKGKGFKLEDTFFEYSLGYENAKDLFEYLDAIEVRN